MSNNDERQTERIETAMLSHAHAARAYVLARRFKDLSEPVWDSDLKRNATPEDHAKTHTIRAVRLARALLA